MSEYISESCLKFGKQTYQQNCSVSFSGCRYSMTNEPMITSSAHHLIANSNPNRSHIPN